MRNMCTKKDGIYFLLLQSYWSMTEALRTQIINLKQSTFVIDIR